MDLYVAFASMFLLSFGIVALGLGIFTTYFGAGKSRAIGVILSLIGVVVLLIFYLMTIDHFGYDWMKDDVYDSFLGVIGMLIGVILSIALVIGLMMVIKEDEPEIPGIEDWEKELEQDDSPDVKSEDAKEDKDASVAEGEKNAEGDESLVYSTRKLAPEEPEAESESRDEMSEFLRDKEEKKIVKEDWEKVDEDGKSIPAADDDEETPAPDDDEEPPAPEEYPDDEEPSAPEDEEESLAPEEHSDDEEPPAPEEYPKDYEPSAPEDEEESLAPEEVPPSLEEMPPEERESESTDGSEEPEKKESD